ncbi:Tetraspanin-20 [Nymphaea thermarum]|nr:Tetraspanin-20 [Nymphaea thermarum]
MTCRGCKGFLASMLKFLNYLQTFVGVAIILYSLWMFSHWNHHDHIPPTSAPSPESAYPTMLNLCGSQPKNRKLVENSKHIFFDELAGLMSSHLEAGRSSSFEKLPPPCRLGVLEPYSLLAAILVLVEAAFVVCILLNKHWEKVTANHFITFEKVLFVLPHDPTGEFDNLRSFIQENIEVCEMVGVVVIIIQEKKQKSNSMPTQVLSLLLAIILRAMVTRRTDYDSENEDDYLRVNHRQPLMIPHEEQSSASASEDRKSDRPDAWRLRMKEKVCPLPSLSLFLGGNHLAWMCIVRLLKNLIRDKYLMVCSTACSHMSSDSALWIQKHFQATRSSDADGERRKCSIT